MTMRSQRMVVALTVGVLAAAFAGGTASAHGDATCSGLGGIEVHGQHIIGDYVTGVGGIGGGLVWPPAGQVGAAIRANGGGAAVPGGPGPGFHFTIPGLAPGASFCNEQAHANGFTTPAHFGS